MKIYEFNDYKRYLLHLIASFPKKGRGQALQLAKQLSVNSVVISQILKGDRHFTPEQALQVAQFYGMDERATDYFLLLVSKERASTQDLIKYHKQKIQKMQEEELEVKARIPEARKISEIEKATFYSNWFYSGIRNLTAIKGYNDVDSIAEYFQMSRAKVRDAVNFLVETGLCVEVDGKISYGPASTFLDPSSVFANNHRRNWRMKSMQKMIEPGPNDLFYTTPFSASAEDMKLIKSEILAVIEKVTRNIVPDSPSEKVACMLIDFFEF